MLFKPLRSTARVAFSTPSFAIAALALILTSVSGITVPEIRAQTLTTLYSFTGNADGQLPQAGVIRDSAGNLYGVTSYGGTYTWGTVFKLTPGGQQTVLYNFTGGSDGGQPDVLIRDSAGNLYGTTGAGGAYSANCNLAGESGCGTVFKLDTHNRESVLHSFAGSTDGQLPSGLIRDSKGNLYGSTYTNGAFFAGTLFKIGATGHFRTLYTFTGSSSSTDGANPNGVTRDSGGNLFGTTAGGGTGPTGTVFKLSPTLKETILYSFAGRGTTDGATPGAGLVDAAGNLYGSTESGGLLGDGTLFKADQNGDETVLHRFTGADGLYPASTMIMDSAGNLYGSTLQGGLYGSGTIFKLDRNNNLTTLHSFNGTDGEYPIGTLVRDSAGNLYGTTSNGGAYGWGTVFKLSPQ